jgi:NADH:ubiquinone oxidoreductase subunit 2 (subunit N)
LLSIITGTFFAISQLRLKRLVIYSSIAQTGFLLSSLSCGLTNSIVVVYFYLIVYLITSFLIWGFIYVFLKSKTSASWYTDLNPLLISSFVKLFKFNKVLSFSFVLIFFSIAGIPPLVGFISKILILQELLSNFFYFTAIFLIVISSVSVFYYIRVIKIIYFEPIETKKNNFVFFFNDSLKLQNLYISFSICLFLLSFLSFTPEFILIFLNIIFQ